MPELGPLEIVTILVVALIVLGPERLPRAARDVGRWVNRMRAMADEVRREFEVSLDEVADEPEEPSRPAPTSPQGPATPPQRGSAAGGERPAGGIKKGPRPPAAGNEPSHESPPGDRARGA